MQMPPGGIAMGARYIVADVFDGLASLDSGSVDLVVTSPPFLALRSYLPADHPLKSKEIGSEASPSEFLDVMLAFTAELRRVVAPHGSICIELGDTYAGSGGAGGDYAESGLREGQQAFRQVGSREHRPEREGTGADGGSRLVPVNAGRGWPLAKSKTLIPELYRIALAYGINPLTGASSPAGQWRIRNVVTWARPNPPVGALGDKWRPATSDVVVACVSGKRYWDDLATRKPSQYADRDYAYGEFAKQGPDRTDTGELTNGIRRNTGAHPSGAPLLDYWEIPLLEGEEPTKYGPKEKVRDYNEVKHRTPTTTEERGGARSGGMFGGIEVNNPAGTPLLDYWEIPPGGYSGSHYAVFPPELVEPCIKAMCPQRVCRTCGEPSRRITETSYEAHSPDTIERQHQMPHGKAALGTKILGVDETFKYGRASRVDQTVGWTDCGHDDWRPGLVLDPFAGSGTTLLVATGHGVDAVGIDLDQRNAVLAEQRVGRLFLEVEHGV